MARSSKIIAPVAVLLLCAVSVVGVGFAYQGSYTDAPLGRDVDSYSLQVDMAEGFHFDSTPIDAKFDTYKDNTPTGDKVRHYLFAEDNKMVTPSTDGKTATYEQLLKISVKAVEKGASGILDFVADKDGKKIQFTDASGFVLSMDVKSITNEDGKSGAHFDLEDGGVATFDVIILVTLSADAVNDGSVNSLTVPAFTFTAKAATSA